MGSLPDQAAGEPLPVHGFVLVGGQSSRMGRDKARLPFRGTPMVAIAVAKLAGVATAVSLVGNRDDLLRFAPVVHEQRMEAGPGAGMEAGLLACSEPWAMFLPVDVPLVPGSLLRQWAAAVVGAGANGCAASYLVVEGDRQPAFCMLRRAVAIAAVRRALDRGERRLYALLAAVEQEAGEGSLWACDAASLSADQLQPNSEQAQLARRFWFSNVNTPAEFAKAETWAAAWDGA